MLRGILPSSRSTPMLVVCFCTPSTCFNTFMWNVSTGLFWGNLRHLQKLHAYVKMGVIKVSYRLNAVWMSSLKDSPIFPFSAWNALNALSLRSWSPDLISPDGVNMNPRYLYCRTFSSAVPFRKNLSLISRPVLLNMRHLVFLPLIVSLFTLQYWEIIFIIRSNWSPFSQSRTISSAQNMELIFRLFIWSPLPKEFRFLANSAMKILNRRGLSTQPCLTPWLMSNCFNIFPSIFMYALSFVYKLLMMLKTLPLIPTPWSFWSRISLGTVSKALLRSIKQL